MGAVRDTNRSRKAYEVRLQRSIEKYEGKLALMKAWENIDPAYYRQLKNEAAKLREQLVIKGAI